MSDIVERLRDASVERQQIAWSRIDGGQDWCIASATADEAASEIERLRAENAKLEKTLAEANEEADVREGEGDTLVGQIKMYVQHRHDLASQNITLRKRVTELEAENAKLREAGHEMADKLTVLVKYGSHHDDAERAAANRAIDMFNAALPEAPR